MIEVHIGLPRSVEPVEAFDRFEFRQVFDTQAGRSRSREYQGHGVDGELGWIGTAWTDLENLADLVGNTAPTFCQLPGARWEFEAIGDMDIQASQTALEGLTSNLQETGFIERVPAPDFEQHFKVSDGRSSPELALATSTLLEGHEFFELTTFGPERPKVIVTVAANDLDEIAAQARDILAALESEKPIAGPLERILGAFRPIV